MNFGWSLEKSTGNSKENIESEKRVKEGVSFVFEQYPELAMIGTPEQYSQYLDRIFPESKLKQVLYHGSRNKEIEKFEIKKENQKVGHSLSGAEYTGFYFTSDFKYAKEYTYRNKYGLPIFSKEKRGKVYPVVLNIKDIKLYRGTGKSDREKFNNEYGQTDVSSINSIQTIKKDEAIDSESIANIYYSRNNLVLHELVLFNLDQIHMLGSQKDVEMFKKFVSEKN